MTRKRDSLLTVVAMSLGFGVVQLDVSVVNVAIRPIGDALGGEVSALQWIVSAYTVMFASFILSAGAFGDRVGARRVFVGGFALAALAFAGLLEIGRSTSYLAMVAQLIVIGACVGV